MKHVKIWFTDFWNGFVPEESLFYKLLASRYEVELTPDPDFLFCSTFGNGHLKYDCVKIFYTGENQVPDFNLFDYALGFEEMTVGDRYLRFPNYMLYGEDLRKMQEKHLNTSVSLKGKTGFCSFVYSNNLASAERERFFDLLSAYRQVSSGGRIRNNSGGPVADKSAFQAKHKFDICFENCSHPGYITEKIVQAFAAGCVPIYWGAPDIAETFNPGAFINCLDYPTFDAVVEKVKEIDTDDALYLQMLGTPALTGRLPDLEEFLYGIFDREPEKAFRRSREFWGRRYLDNARAREKAFDMSPRGLWRKIYRKTLWKWRRKNSFLWKLDKMAK